MKANHKRLKAILASKVKKLSPFFLVLKLGKFSFFDDFFFDLADFWNLDNFQIFDNFLYFSINLSSFLTLSTSLIISTLSAINTYDNIVVFNIDINGAAILLKS